MLTCFIFTGALFLSDGQGLMLRHDQAWMTEKRRGHLVVDAGYRQDARFDLPMDWQEKSVPEILRACRDTAVSLDNKDPSS